MSEKGCAHVRVLAKRVPKTFLEVFSSQPLIFMKLIGIYV